MTTTTTMTKRGVMTGYLSRAGGVSALTLAVAIAAAAAPLLSPTSVSAQVRMTVPPQSEPVALRGATIHTVTNGVIENGTILFENGVIIAVGTDVEIPAGARVVDVSGKHIYPGLIDAYSTVASRVTSTSWATSTPTFEPRSQSMRRAATSAPPDPPACS